MAENLALILPFVVLVSHFVFVFLLLSLAFRKSWGAKIQEFLGRHAIILAFLVLLVAVLGSLFYSGIVGFEPCVLCWWQRVFLYPSVLILGIALFKKDRKVFDYVVYLVLLSAIIAFYQYYTTSLGGASILTCTDDGGVCSRVYVKAFGYITIELMSLTVSLFVLLFAWANKIYKSER